VQGVRLTLFALDLYVQVVAALHHQIRTELRRQIAAGELAVGSPLPSEAQLCERFEVSRGTVRQALTALRAEGAIGGGRGKPPVVRPPVVSQDFSELVSFSAWALATGHQPGQQTLEVARRRASRDVADALALEPGAPIVEALRVRLLDGRPVMLEHSRFVEGVGRLLFDWDLDTGSIYGHLQAAGVDLARATQVIDAVPAAGLDAEHLGVPPGAPLLRVRRRATAGDGEPLEWSEDRYRGDAMAFTLESAVAGAAGFARVQVS
jgi:GntR family transcriptional regulator